jgi:DNA-directed RNA polymerase specialized sigma24 family protein
VLRRKTGFPKALVDRVGGSQSLVPRPTPERWRPGGPGCAQVAILELIRGGQSAIKPEQKVTQLFEANRDAVYRYVLIFLADTGESEEVTQEAFIRLCRYLKAGHSVGHLRAWVFRVAHNLALNQQKSRKFFDSSDSVPWDELCRLRLDPGPNPEKRVEAFRFVHDEGVTSIFHYFQSCATDALLHVSTDAATRALRRRDDQCGLVDFRQGRPEVNQVNAVCVSSFSSRSDGAPPPGPWLRPPPA